MRVGRKINFFFYYCCICEWLLMRSGCNTQKGCAKGFLTRYRYIVSRKDTTDGGGVINITFFFPGWIMIDDLNSFSCSFWRLGIFPEKRDHGLWLWVCGCSAYQRYFGWMDGKEFPRMFWTVFMGFCRGRRWSGQSGQLPLFSQQKKWKCYAALSQWGGV